MASEGSIEYYRLNDQKCGGQMIQREEQEPRSEAANFGHGQETLGNYGKGIGDEKSWLGSYWWSWTSKVFNYKIS